VEDPAAAARAPRRGDLIDEFIAPAAPGKNRDQAEGALNLLMDGLRYRA
jgi:hypothetical protein